MKHISGEFSTKEAMAEDVLAFTQLPLCIYVLGV